MVAGIIIAKKESKRLPNKNIRDFCGLPLVAWSIIQSKCSKLIDETYLSTDSDEIAQIGEDLGAEIIWRDYEIKDYCANVAFAHAIRKIRETKPLKTVITILPTSPASPPDQYDEMIRAFNKEGVKDMILTAPLDEQILVKRIDHYRARLIAATKEIGDHMVTGGCGIQDADWYLEMEKRFPKTDTEINNQLEDYLKNLRGKETRYYLGKWWQAFDIDDEKDFLLVQYLMQTFVLRGRGPSIYYDYKEEE